MNETTSGTDTREPRTLDAPALGFDVARELEQLRAEPGYGQFGRSSKTLAKGTNLRLVRTAARAGVEIGDDDAEGAVAVHVLEGGVRATGEGDGLAFGAGQVVWFGEGGPWGVRVEQDAALLLSVGWPGAATGEEESHERA